MAQSKEERTQKGIEYRKGHVRQMKFDLSIEHDADILAHLDALPNRAGYIKALIRADIAARANSEAKKEDPTMKYEVNLSVNGATSPIDTIEATAGYTAADYIRDCNENADGDWCEMLSSGTVTLTPIEDDSRAKSEEKKEDPTMPIRINFEAGTSRDGSHAVNFMMPAPGANSPDLYAEIPVPDGAEEEYGYFYLEQEILRQAVAQNIPVGALRFWYDNQEDLLSPAARAGQRAKSISLDNGRTFTSADQGAYLEIAARKMWPVVVASMDDATREYVAREGIGDPAAFLARYLELAPCDLCIG